MKMLSLAMLISSLVDIQAQNSLHATVVNTAITGEIPSDFVSLSIGFSGLQKYFGSQAFVNAMSLLSSINPNQRGPNVRIGGQSTDFYVYSSTATSKSKGLVTTPCNGCYMNSTLVNSTLVVPWVQPVASSYSVINMLTDSSLSVSDLMACNSTPTIVNSASGYAEGYSSYVLSKDLTTVASSLTQFGGTITFGLNFYSQNDPTQAEVMASTIMQSFKPSQILAFEIGNEPSGYQTKVPYIRPYPYLPTTYFNEQQSYINALASIIPAKSIQGGAFCCGRGHPEWDQALPSYFSTFASQLNSLSYHSYDMNTTYFSSECGLADVSNGNGAATLLDNANMKAITQRFVDIGLVQLCKENSIPLIIGEGNTANEGGIPGISDTYVSALWAVDQMMNFATIGAQRFNFYSSTAQAFNVFTPSINFKVMPIFYGMWAFATATAGSSKLFQVHYDTSNNFASGSINVYAAVGSLDGVVRITAVNKLFSTASDSMITLDVSSILTQPTSSLIVSVKRLVQSQIGSYNATSGISFNGLTFDNVINGIPTGTQSTETIPISSAGVVTFSINPLSVVILEIRRDLSVSNKSDANSNIISLDVGLGVGIPLVFIGGIVIFVLFLRKNKLQNK